MLKRRKTRNLPAKLLNFAKKTALNHQFTANLRQKSSELQKQGSASSHTTSNPRITQKRSENQPKARIGSINVLLLPFWRSFDAHLCKFYAFYVQISL